MQTFSWPGKSMEASLLAFIVTLLTVSWSTSMMFVFRAMTSGFYDCSARREKHNVNNALV